MSHAIQVLVFKHGNYKTLVMSLGNVKSEAGELAKLLVHSHIQVLIHAEISVAQ